MTARDESKSWGGVSLWVAIILAVVVVAGGLAWVVFLQTQQHQLGVLRQQLTSTQEELTQRASQNQELAQQLDALRKERKSLEERLASLRTQLASATTELEQARENLKELQVRHEALSAERTKERAELQASLTTVTAERDQAKQAVSGLEQERTALQRSVNRLRERMTWIDRDYRRVSEQLARLEADRHAAAMSAPMSAPPTPQNIVPPSLVPGAVTAAVATGSSAPSAEMASSFLPPSSFSLTPPAASTISAVPSAAASGEAASMPHGAVELPPIIVRKERGAGLTAPIQGRILEVNGPYHFVVLDKGSVDGVHVGMVFEILRGGVALGRTTVSRVRPKLSACDMSRALASNALQVGDLAVQRAEFGFRDSP